LQDNLENALLSPRSVDWRDSLFLLAETLQRQGIEALTRASSIRPQALVDEQSRRNMLNNLDESTRLLGEATLRFDEFLQRYPEDARVYRGRYLMAEAYRHQSKAPRWKLPWEAIEPRRLDLERNMRSALEAAFRHYDQLVTDLNKKQDTQELEPVEQAIQRNSYFARAHTLFDLKRYEEALEAYSTATSRYQSEPASLEAYQQMAACYRKLGDPAKAQGAIEHAKMVIANMPTGVDYEKTTRFPRDVWMNLLK
jgi:tetratricopeptide (TPR) repeat protein